MNEVNSDKSDEPEETLFNASSSSASESEMEGMSVFVGSMNTFSDDPSHTRLTYLKKTKPKIRLRSWDACLNQFCATPGSSFDFTTQFRNVSHLFPTSYLPAWNDEDFNVDDIFQPSTVINQWEPNSLQPPQPDLSPSAAPDRLSNVLRCGTTDGRVNRKGWIYLPSTKASSDKCCSGGTKECHSSTMLSTLYEKDTCNIKDTGIRASFDCDIDRLYNNRVRRASVDSETTELMNRDSSETEFCSSQLDCEDREKKTSRRRVSDRKRSENRNMCRKKGDEVGEFNGIKEEDATEIIDEIKKLEEDDELKDVDRVYDAHEVKEEDEEFKDINRMEAVGYTDEIKKVEEDDEMEDFEEHKYFDAYDEEDDEDYVKEEVEEHDDEYEYQELEDGEAEKLIEDMRMFELQLQERGPRFLLQFGYDDGDEEYESEDDDDGDAGGHDGHDDDDDENEEDEEDEDDDGEDENDEDNEEEEEEEEEGEQSEVDEEEEEEIGEEDEEEVEIEVEINENDDEEEREGEVRIQEVVEEEDDVENEEHDEIEGMEEEDEGEEEEKDEEVKMEEVVKEKRKDLFGTRFDEEIDEKRKRYEDMTSYLFEPDEYNDSEFGAERTVIPIYREDVMNPPGVQMDDPILYDAYMEYVKNEAGEDMEESEETEKRLEEIHLIYLKRREEEAAEYAKTKNQEPGFLEDEESRSKLAEDLELGADFFKKKSEQQPEEQDTKDEEYNHNDTDEEDHRNNNELKQPSNDGGDSESDESENVDYRCKRYYSKIFKDDDSDSDETESSEECEDEFVDVDECEEDNSVESHYGKYEDDEHRFEHDYHVGEISIPSEIHEERYISEQQSARSYASSEEMNTENVNREPNSPEIDVCESYAYDSQGNGEYHNSEDMQYDEYQRLGTEDFPPLVYNDSQAAETSDGVSSEHQLSADYRNFIEPVDDDDYPSDEFKGYEPVEVGEYESGVVDELGYQELEEYGPAEFEPHLSFEIHEDRLTGMVGESNENVESLQLELERLNDCRSTDHELIDVDTTILNASVCEVLVSDTAEQLGINTENHELVEHNNSQVDGTNNPGLKQHLPQEQCSTLPLISLEDSSRSSLITCEDGLSTNYAGHASGLEEQRIDSLEQEEISSYPCNDHILPSTMLDGPVREQIEVAFCEQPMSSSNEFNNESKRRTRTNEKYPVVKKSSGNVGNSDGDHTATSETRRGCDALHKLSVSSGRKRQNCVLHCCSDYIPKPSEKKTNRASRPSRRNKMEMIVDDKDSSDNTQRYLRASYGSDDEDHVGESYFCTENADIVVDLQDPDTDTEEPTVEFNDESKETRHLLRTYTAPDRVPGSGISRTTHTKKPECKRSVEAMVIESLKESREKYNNKTSKVDFSRSSKQASVYGYH